MSTLIYSALCESYCLFFFFKCIISAVILQVSIFQPHFQMNGFVPQYFREDRECIEMLV